MKQNPDLIPFKEWSDKFTDAEICEILGIDMDDLDDLRNEDVEIERPSCDGNGDIELDHSFYNKNGKRDHSYYMVECEYCNGETTVLLDKSNLESELTIAYAKLVKLETSKYNDVLIIGHI